MARALVSIIIPTLNSRDELASCLGSLSEGLTSGVIRELIVTDGGSQDGTADLAAEAGAINVAGAPSRGGQLRRGCASASGEWLLVLHADTQLSAGWAEVVLDHVRSQSGPAYFKLSFRAKGMVPKIVAGWANLRARIFGLPYGDQGLLIARSDYDNAGGFADVPIMEDVDLIRKLTTRARALPATASTSAEKYIAQGWVRRGTLNLLMLMRYLLGTSPEQLAREYTRKR